MSAQKWLTLDGHERSLAETASLEYLAPAWDAIPELLGFHDTCYRQFTDAKRIRGAEKRCSQKSQDHHPGQDGNDTERAGKENKGPPFRGR